MLFFTLFFFLFGCQDEKPSVATNDQIVDSYLYKKSVDAVDAEEAATPFESLPPASTDSLSYGDTKLDIGKVRLNLKQHFDNGSITIDSVKTVFAEQLTDKLIPYWYGTPWSFEGHTAIPKKGRIACGYFISTTLRDMGLKLNRYKLAQKSPIDEAKVISCGAPITSITQSDSKEAFLELNRLTTDGIYFIGFDKSHVGYLLKKRGKLFLVHSNYLSPTSVCIERLEDSRVFESFSTFHLVDISNNELLLANWLGNEPIF
ncbi:hypothetical protein [Maribacter sp. 2307UL18-2]|uniref:hypothetical protein n=1 Tax=Maribacter sp. 2307UL18-2 TaxID=3386274 RepID=UPI0039BCABF7